MKSMSIAEIRDAVSGKIVQGDPKHKIDSISIDSRTIEPGQLFIAIIGERFDGHQFIPDAIAGGAKALIVDRSIKAYPGVDIIIVEDTTVALQKLAHTYRMQFSGLKIVGVTGSAGKTTTKDMIAGILSQKFNVKKTRGNLNNYYGLPLTLLELDGDEDIAVLEMGMSRLGEIKLLTDIARPQVGVVTNVGPTHLEYLKTVANVAQGKRELIEGLPEDGIAVLNYDNSYVREMEDYFSGKRVICYGMDKRADIYAENITFDDEKGMTTFDVIFEGEKERIIFDKPGKHNVYNALAAIAVARYYGLSWEEIKAGLMNIELSSLRWDVKKINNNILLINDTYNANPLSMEAAITAAKEMAKKRVITVLGAMLELGPEEKISHLELGEFVYNQDIDVLITVGKLGELITQGAIKAGMNEDRVFVYDNNQKAAKQLLQIMKPGDTILVKGSRGIKMEEIVEEVVRQGA